MSDPRWVGGAEAGGAGGVTAGEGSLPEAMANGASCAAAGSGCIAAEDFLSLAAGAAAEIGWAETPDLPLLGPSCVVAAAGAAIEAAIGAAIRTEALEFGARFGVKGAGSLLEVLLAMTNPVSEAVAVCAATVTALGERVRTGTVWRAAPPVVAAGVALVSAAVELTALGPMGATAELSDAESTGVELLTLAALALETAGCCAFGDSVTDLGPLLVEDCGAGIGVGDVVVIASDIAIAIGIGDGAVAGAEDGGATLVAGTPREAGLGL